MAARIVLITGANSGIGYAISQTLVQASSAYHIIMTGRALTKIDAARSEIESSSNNNSSNSVKNTLSTLQLDVTDSSSINKAVEYVRTTYGHLDVLINNAGSANPSEDIATRMRATFETNVIGPAVMSESFRPLLLASKNPYSILVSSVVGSMTLAASSEHKRKNEETYRSSKAALNMLAVIENRDFGPQGLKVFAICPGFVVSNLRGSSQEQRSGGGNAKDPMTSADFVSRILLGERDADVGKLIHDEGIYPW